jgi:hypothetical protein
MTRSIVAVVAGLTLLWSAPAALAAGEASAGDTSQHAGDTWNTLKAYSVDKKDEAVAYGKRLMKDADANLAQLEAKASGVSGKSRTDYEKTMAELKVKRAAAAAKLGEMEKQTGRAWGDAKRGFADAYQDLAHASDQAIKRFK